MIGKVFRLDRNKGATINPKNKKDNKCFQWSTTSALNYNKI